MTVRRFNRPGRKPLSRSHQVLTTITVVASVAFVIVLVVRSVQQHDALIQWRQALNGHGAGPAWPAWDEQWSPLPAPRRLRGVRLRDLHGPYAHAAVNPEILKQIPCYCGCARLGHRSNRECYIRGRTADGKPIWDDHTFTCPMCAAITREVALLFERGSTIRAARQAIDAVYGPRYGAGTPTPPVRDEHEHRTP